MAVNTYWEHKREINKNENKTQIELKVIIESRRFNVLCPFIFLGQKIRVSEFLGSHYSNSWCHDNGAWRQSRTCTASSCCVNSGNLAISLAP